MKFATLKTNVNFFPLALLTLHVSFVINGDLPVPPNVRLFKRQDNVTCHATGFYPEGVNITLKKDGVEIRDNVDVGDTLPNEDGTYQKRVVLMQTPQELQETTCEVAHSSGSETISYDKLSRDADAPQKGLLKGVFFLFSSTFCVQTAALSSLIRDRLLLQTHKHC